MATLLHNISGDLTTELLAPGDKVGNITSILIANTHASAAAVVDLYIGTYSKSSTASVEYYFFKGQSIASGSYLLFSNDHLIFNNGIDKYGLFIKLGASTSTVDVHIKRG